MQFLTMTLVNSRVVFTFSSVGFDNETTYLGLLSSRSGLSMTSFFFLSSMSRRGPGCSRTVFAMAIPLAASHCLAALLMAIRRFSWSRWKNMKPKSIICTSSSGKEEIRKVSIFYSFIWLHAMWQTFQVNSKEDLWDMYRLVWFWYWQYVSFRKKKIFASCEWKKNVICKTSILSPLIYVLFRNGQKELFSSASWIILR